MIDGDARALLRSFPWGPVAISLFIVVSVPRLFFDQGDPLIFDFAAGIAMAIAILLGWASIAAWLRGDPYDG